MDSSAAAYSAQPSIDLNPGIGGGGVASSGSDQTFRSDQSVAQRMEQMELSSGENQQVTSHHHDQPPADDPMDLCTFSCAVRNVEGDFKSLAGKKVLGRKGSNVVHV